MFLKSSVSLKQEIKYDKIIDFIRILYTVKNFDEFTEYILNNGLPQFVSFDHDLGKGEKKGLDCARWLVKYCRETNNKLPKFFAHSANNNGREQINRVLNGTMDEDNQYNKRKTMKQIKTLTESKLRGIIREAVRKSLNEWDSIDPNDESYRERNLGDSAHNIKAIIDKAISELDNGKIEWWARELCVKCRDYIEDYAKIFG